MRQKFSEKRAFDEIQHVRFASKLEILSRLSYSIIHFIVVVGMARLIVFAILIASCFKAQSQELFTISLADYSLKTDSISFKISEIIDARKDNKVVGVIQRGMKNRKDLAVFEKPGVQELEELLSRSGLVSKDKGIAIRLSKLAISEITSMWKETARAELSLDFFVQYNNDYYYITSVYATAEPRGSDVTRLHQANIASVVEQALIQFSAKASEVNSLQAYTKDELMDPSQNFRSVTAMPIIQASQYKDGYYATFDEFIQNQPSISIGCEVELNSTTIVDCEGSEKETNIYGYAKDNQLYIAFHQEFYPLKKINNEFIFYGPNELSGKDIEDAYKGMIIPRQLGKRSRNSLFKLDLSTGSVKGEMGF